MTTGWQPIETVPKDRQVDLWYDEVGRRGPAVWHPADDFYIGGGWVFYSNEREGVLVSEPNYKPTHWMEWVGMPARKVSRG